MILTDQLIDHLPMDRMHMDAMDKFSTRKSTFRPDPLPGYHPDDLIDYGWDDFDDPTDEDEESK